MCHLFALSLQSVHFSPPHCHAVSCTSVTVSGVGLSSGTYTEVTSSYDAHYEMATGIDLHELYLYSGTWYIEPDIAGYPRYRVSYAVYNRFYPTSCEVAVNIRYCRVILL